MDEEILGSVLHGIKPKDYTPIQVRPTPEFGGIQLTEEQQAKKDNMESVKDGEILPLGGFTDTVEAQWESAKDLVKSTDVYKNLFGNSAPDDNRLEQSEKLGSALGIAPQLIASDPDMYKAAVTTYERQRNAAALNNQPFSAKTLNELYPELDTEDPVATTIALKDYTNILKSREAAAQGAAVYTMPESKLTDLSNVIGYLYDTGTHFAGTAYKAGQALDAQSELMYKASIGEISDEEVEKAIPDLMNAQKAYNAEIGDSYVAKIVGETISQLSMQKNMIMRGAAEILSPIAPLAQPILAATKTNLPQIATLGAASAAGAVGATGVVAGAAVTGAAALTGLIALGTASVFTGTYRAEAGQAYWDWRTQKDKNGKSVYTREQAIGHAKRVGRINAAIETGAWELALKGITKVWGSDAAKAVIKNEAAMKKLIGAGRAAVGAKAIGYGAKQFAKVAAPEIAEEGLQSLSADMDTRLFGKETVPVREMMGNALDAMIEAVPSVVGMSIGGAALAGTGAHRAMKRIAGLSEMKDAVIEFKRENERSMLQKLMDLRSESSLYQKAPETYRKTLQNQLDHTGSGTLYIDASAAAENEKTHDALNKLVEDGTITAKELDDAIKTGKPLEVETGKYMQTATPETHEALSDYTTMDKGEKTIHAIREERQRMKDMIDIVTMTREKREAAAAEKILNDHFSDDTDIGREDRDTAREILSGGLDHIEDTCKTILQEAKDAWGKLTGVKELQDYMEQRKTQDANFSNEKGVDMFDVGEGKDRVHLRVSKNPDWYQDFYGAYGRAPNQRELYDIAQEKIIAENDKGDEESKVAIAEIEEAKKRVESIERVSETLKSLNKEDLIAQTLLDPETYEEAYKPLLEEIKAAGNGAVTKAARDSALVLAKIAENFHNNYGVPLKLAMIAAGEVSPETTHQLNQSAIENELQLVKEKYWNTEEWMKAPDGTPTKLTERQWLITHSETFREWFGDWETVEKVTKLYYGNPIVMTEGGLKEKLEKAARDNGINIAADADSIRKEIKTIFKSLYPGKELSKGYREPGRVKNLDGELISITVSSAKELRHHSTNPRTLFLAVNLDSVIENATFLYEEVKDESRVKKSNQTTLAYRYYATRVVVNGEECIARIIVRKDKNGNLYFYDGDITSNEQIKKDLPKYLYPDTKTGQNLGKSLFTHSIQEWLAKVKETTDKIGGNGEVLASVVNDFEESSTYHQMAGEHARNAPLDKLEVAKKMEEEEASPEEIWDTTGWMRGPEGEWRFEIPDNLDQIDLSFAKDQDRISLWQIYSNPQLYEAYPALANVKVYAEDTGKAYSGADGFTDEDGIHLSKEFIEKNPKEAKSALIHELQHVIQMTVEDRFSKGGNPKIAEESMEMTLWKLEVRLEELKLKEPERSYIEAMQENDKQAAEAMNNGDFAKFISLSKKKKEIRKNGPENKEEIDNILRNIETLKNATKETEHGDPHGYKKYRRLGGEAEAFMTSERAEGKQAGMPNYDTGYGYPVANFAGETFRFSLAQREKSAAEQQLDADEKSFADSVDRFMAGKISTDTIQVMRTPLVMRLVGAEVLPVEISVSDLKKVLVDKHTDITPDIMKQIPRALTDPMMIFSTYSGKNGEVRKVIVLELKDKNGATIVIPMELERKKGNYEVNQITSAYGKTDKKTRRTSFVWFQKQLQEGKLEYANRKKATDWISSEQPHWLIPEEKVDNLLSAPNVANEENLVKLKSENPTYYQTAADKDLVAMHNIDLGNLAAAIKLGGLPVPSIAVTKKQTPYTGFGDATLIMKKDTVDPSKTPVFSRDAWTGVFPKVIRLANMKRLTSFVEKAIEPLQEELPREVADYGDIYNSYILRNANNKNGDVQKMLEDSLNSAGYKYYFLKTINKEPKLKWRKKGLNKELIDHPKILKACQGLEKKYGKQGLKELLYEGPSAMLEESTDLKEANDLIVNELSKKPEGNESPFLKRVHKRQQARLVNGETLHSLLSDYLERDKKVFEEESFKQQLDKRIKANQNTFNAWKESFRDEMLGESVIRDSGKPADLENIVDAMLGNLKNAQKGFAGFGIGNIIASSAKKIESFGEMHREADRNMDGSTNIETSLDKSEQYTKVKDEIIDFTGRMAEAYKWEDSWESRSDASQVLMSMMSGKTFKASARKFGFTYSAALEKQAKEIIKEVKNLPAKYFEAKPQRAVRFSEVAAAVMPKNASKEIKDYLRAQGVTIRLYDPRIEGDRERVTNSAQDRVKQYFQEGSNYQGSYDRNTNVIELFDGANESTVVHEGAHMFLSMLENMSQMSEENVATYFNGDTAKARAALKSMQGDLSTIRSWAAFSEDHLSEYKGTILEKEFTKYAEDIRAGKAGAMERWMQERFARGFEKYLMDGSAPTKEMQGVFRRFKKWLTDIYKTAKSLGNVELTPEIKDIFDRMISTESEINAWAAQRKLEAIDKTVNVNQSELGNLKAWAESVKDKALEKAMSYYLHMVREEAIENFRASISSEEERTSFIESLGEENEIYQIETIYNSGTFPTRKDRDEFLQMAGFTEKDLKEKLRVAGGTTEERWNKHIEEMVQHYREEALTPEAIRSMAEEILRSPEGMAKKSRIEAMLLEKKVSAYIHLVNSMQMELKRSKDKKKTAREIRKRLGLVSEKETTEIDKQTDVIAKSEDKIAKLEKQKKLLKEQLEKAKAEAAAAKGENKSRKESQTILEGNMRALEAELEKERAQRAKADSTTKDAELTAADLAVQLQTMVDGLKESRDAMRFDMREIKEDARNTLGGEKLSHATSWRWWENKAQIAEARAMKAAAGNDWEGAAYWKREQAQCLTMAKFARANEEEIRRTLHGGGGKVTTPLLNENGMERYGILGILNRISRTDKPVMMKDDARYFVQHMAYVLGLTKKDGILPIDESGQERPFNWRWLAVEMNPMQAMDDDRYVAEDIIPGWMRSAFEGSTALKLKDLTMDQFREMAKVMKAVYKLGRREYEGNTLGTSFDEASQKIHDEILGNWTHRVATPGLKNQTATNLDRLGTKIHSLIKDITLSEILIERMGKSAAEYFYKPMDKAAAHLRELKSAARVTFRKNFAIYSRKEWTAIRSKKLYTIGLDERGKPVSYTKEQLLAMALNFGTKSNRARLIETLWLSDTLNTDEKTILDMLDKNLTDKDWDFVESVWEHLNSYWGERNKVQNDLYGTPLGKVQGEDFTLKSGRVIHGAYYRIKYDPLSSAKTSNFSTTDIAKMDMQNISSFSLGMGSTKQRAGTSGGQKLRLDLDVYVEAVNEAMQHIAMREATVDVYKLLNRKEVVAAIENTAGPETLSLLQGWAKDCWHSSIKDMSEWDSTLGRARRRFNFTTMGFRFSTALLNIGNITGMMDRMGAMNALKAVGDFYFHGNIVEQRRFIQNKSTMMRDRGATIDRDMYMQDRLPVGKNESELRSKIEHGKYGVDTLNSKAYWLIQATDEMFSLPEWLYTYKNAMAVMEVDGKLTREEMDAEAVRLADKAVRETFGSNETKDQTSFTRKNGILAQMTTFYSYTNLVTNQFIRAGYILYDKGDVKPLLEATWYWWILGALVETTLREIGDDSDDEDKWKKKFLHVIASGGPIGGVPLAREAVPWTVDFFTGKSFGSAAPDAPFFDTLKHMENFLKAAKKGDLIEMGRGATKAITRTSIPVPDTITDAFWNFMRMACTDTEFTMWDWFRKSLWDKTLKEKKK